MVEGFQQTFIEIQKKPATPEQPSGKVKLCQAGPAEQYSVQTVPNASEYEWLITPSEAGSISGNAISCYVIWNKNGIDHKGWVYFVDDVYITIETGVKPKPNCEYTKIERHKYIHTLLLCFPKQWKELEYVHTRKNRYAESLADMEVFVREFQ